MRWFAFLASALLMTALAFTQEVPAGTVIPIMLTTTVDSAKAHAGQEIAGTVMEAVPLPSGGRIPAKAKLLGHVVAARLGYPESPAVLALQFDKIVFRGHEAPISVNVRAIASMVEVFDAQVPVFVPDTTPRASLMFAPVGGEAAFRPDNPEESWREFVRFSGELAPGCGGRVDKPGTTGALWVFSPYACGAYGFGSNLSIAHDGATDPKGQIVFSSRKHVSIQAGSGFLLRVQDPPPVE